LLKLSPITKSILSQGAITFAIRVFIEETEFSHLNGLVSVNLVKESLLNNKISSNSFDIILTDDSANNISYNPSYPTFPEIMNINAKVRVLIGYSRWNEQGVKTSLDNHIIQWFQAIVGVTSQYSYSSKARSLTIRCLDRVEELINYGDYKSPVFEYLTIPEILDIIANNPREPLVGTDNLVHNGDFRTYSENTKFPQYWESDVLHHGGLTRYNSADSRLPSNWAISDINYINRYSTAEKEYDDYNTIYPNHDFITPKNRFLNTTWDDMNFDGIADWWTTVNITGANIQNKSNIDTSKVQKISASDGKFYQILDPTEYKGETIVISGSVKSSDGFRFVAYDGVTWQTGSSFTLANFADVRSEFAISSSATILYAGVQTSGEAEISSLRLNLESEAYSPNGFTITTDSISKDRSKMSNVSYDGSSKSYVLVATGATLSHEATEYEAIMTGSGVVPSGITIDMLFKTTWSPSAGDFINNLKFVDCNEEVYNVDLEIPVADSNWKYVSLNLQDSNILVNQLPKAFIHKVSTHVTTQNNTLSVPILFDKYRMFKNELLGNPCFYDSDGDGTPDGYSLTRSTSNLQISIDSGNFVAMNQSLRFNNLDDNGIILVRKSITDFEKGVPYSLAGNYYAENLITADIINAGAFAQMNAYDANDNNVFSLTTPRISGFSDWQDFELPFLAQDNMYRLEVVLGVRNASGIALFNDVKLISDVDLFSQKNFKEYALRVSKTNEDFDAGTIHYASTQMDDTFTSMYSGASQLSKYKTLSAEFLVGDDYEPAVRTFGLIADSFFEGGDISDVTTSGSLTVSVNKSDESLLGKNCLELEHG
jgi:hypothetical protein